VIAEGKIAVIRGSSSPTFATATGTQPRRQRTREAHKADIVAKSTGVGLGSARALPVPRSDVRWARHGHLQFGAGLQRLSSYAWFWKTYDAKTARDGGEKFFLQSGRVMETATLTTVQGSITKAIVRLRTGVLRVYGPGRQCNARTVDGLGKYAIVQDHDEASCSTSITPRSRARDMLTRASVSTPNYPMVSAQGGHCGSAKRRRAVIKKGRKVLYPALEHGAKLVDYIQRVKARWIAWNARSAGDGLRRRLEGCAHLPGPRGAGATPVSIRSHCPGNRLELTSYPASAVKGRRALASRGKTWDI